MINQRKSMAVAVAIALAFPASFPLVWADDAPPIPGTRGGTEVRDHVSAPDPYYAVDGAGPGVLSGRDPSRAADAIAGISTHQARPKYDRARAAIRDIQVRLGGVLPDQQRAELVAKLRTLMSEYFDQDLQRRRDEIAAVKKRVKVLEELIRKRKEAKDQIIDLQLKVFENEQQGLEFFR